MPEWTSEIEGPSEGTLEELDELRGHLRELQLPQIVHGRRAVVLLEGPQGAGKKYALRQIAAAFDPCHFAVHAIDFDRRQAAEGHWLARFWRALPAAGNTAIFFHSWYRRVLDDRVVGNIDEARLTRAFDEINEFEAQQRDYGTLIVKLYFDVSPEVQEHRLRERARDPWLGVMRSERRPLSIRDPAYSEALGDLRRHTDTRWSPWHMIDGNNELEGALASLSVIADAWSKAMPSEPPRVVNSQTEAA